LEERGRGGVNGGRVDRRGEHSRESAPPWGKVLQGGTGKTPGKKIKRIVKNSRKETELKA